MQIKNVLPNPNEIPGDRKYVPDWRENLPEGSLWSPGSKGKPACDICRGTGWVRLNVSTGHPLFGKLQFCKCVDPIHQTKLDYENSPSYRPTSKDGSR